MNHRAGMGVLLGDLDPVSWVFGIVWSPETRSRVEKQAGQNPAMCCIVIRCCQRSGNVLRVQPSRCNQRDLDDGDEG
jgi:hypothetical protein